MDLVKQNIPVLEVRVLDAIRKSSFRVRRLMNFPLVDTLSDLRKELATVLPDLPNVDKCQIGYVLERNKKFAIDSDIDVKNAYDYFISGYQMWLDPEGRQHSTKSSRRGDERGNVNTPELAISPIGVSKEDKILAEIEALKLLHGNQLPPYKYRLWAEMIIVGTANREKIPEVPMFSASPAKRPRRETIADTLTSVGNSIAQALQPGAAPVQQAHENNTLSIVQSRSETLKQIRELFELKNMGAISEEEYEQKKQILLKDI